VVNRAAARPMIVAGGMRSHNLSRGEVE
jgi:hypothetical protein